MTDEEIVADWKQRPGREVGFDMPGHLNPDFDYEFDEDQILEGDFYRQRLQQQIIFPRWQQIRENLVANPPFQNEEEPREPRQDDQFYRWYRTMPLVWEALSLQPIGHQVELGGVRGMFRMQGCRLRLTIRSAQEEDALRRILEILGYRHTRYRQLNQVFIRRDFPIADPRQALRAHGTDDRRVWICKHRRLRSSLHRGGTSARSHAKVDARLHANMVDFY